MLDHFGTINVSIETIYNDLLQAIPYDSALIITNNEFNLFIRDFASNQNYSVSGYAYYGKLEMIKNAKMALHLLNIKAFTRYKKCPERAAKIILLMLQ